MPDEPSGLGTAGKICQEVQGQGIRAVRAGYVGHETGQSDTGRGYGRG